MMWTMDDLQQIINSVGNVVNNKFKIIDSVIDLGLFISQQEGMENISYRESKIENSKTV